MRNSRSWRDIKEPQERGTENLPGGSTQLCRGVFKQAAGEPPGRSLLSRMGSAAEPESCTLGTCAPGWGWLGKQSLFSLRGGGIPGSPEAADHHCPAPGPRAHGASIPASGRRLLSWPQWRLTGRCPGGGVTRLSLHSSSESIARPPPDLSSTERDPCPSPFSIRL